MSDKDNLHIGPETDTTLWRFALSLWQQEAARDLCLRLQEKGWSVTRLLCAGWLASQGAPFSGNEPQGAQEWRQNVTESIRSLKQSLNKSDSLLATLRASLAQAELEAERIELYRAWLLHREADSEGKPRDGEQIMTRNLRRAAPSANGHIDETTESMINDLAQHMTATTTGQNDRTGRQQT